MLGGWNAALEVNQRKTTNRTTVYTRYINLTDRMHESECSQYLFFFEEPAGVLPSI